MALRNYFTADFGLLRSWENRLNKQMAILKSVKKKGPVKGLFQLSGLIIF